MVAEVDSAGGAPPGDRDRRALVAVAGQFFVNGAMTASFLARAPQIRDRIGVEVDEFGLLLTVASVFGLVGSALAGRVVHRATTRRVLQAGAVVMVASVVVIGAARSPAVWLGGMLAYQLLDVMVDISMNLQGSWLSARRRAPVMHRLHGLWSLGTFAGGLGAVAANGAGLSVATHLALTAVVLGGVLVLVTRHLLTDDEEGHGEAGAAETAPASAGPGRRPSRLPVVLLVLAGTFAVVPEVTGGDWSSFRLTDDFGASPALGSLAFVAFTVGMTSMRVAGDALQVRLGRHGLHRLSVTVTVVGFTLAALVPADAVAVVGFVLVGLGVATFMPRVYDDAAHLPGRRGAGMALMTGGMRVAFLVTPVAVGSLAGTSLSVGDAIALVTLPCLAGLVVVTEWSHRLLQRGAQERGPAGP